MVVQQKLRALEPDLPPATPTNIAFNLEGRSDLNLTTTVAGGEDQEGRVPRTVRE